MFKLPTASVENYKEMLAKISFFTGISAFVCIVILSAHLPPMKEFISWLDIQLKNVSADTLFGIPSTIIGEALIAILFAIITSAVKLHDRLSDFFGIRDKFDVNFILYPLAIASGASLSINQFVEVRKNRETLMSDTFYEYASSTNPVIDSHTITQSLTNWSWFWVCLETMMVFSLSALILVFYGAFQPAALLFIACAGLLFLMRLFYIQSTKYGESQIKQILKINTQRADVSNKFNAL